MWLRGLVFAVAVTAVAVTAVEHYGADTLVETDAELFTRVHSMVVAQRGGVHVVTVPPDCVVHKAEPKAASHGSPASKQPKPVLHRAPKTPEVDEEDRISMAPDVPPPFPSVTDAPASAVGPHGMPRGSDNDIDQSQQDQPPVSPPAPPKLSGPPPVPGAKPQGAAMRFREVVRQTKQRGSQQAGDREETVTELGPEDYNEEARQAAVSMADDIAAQAHAGGEEDQSSPDTEDKDANTAAETRFKESSTPSADDNDAGADDVGSAKVNFAALIHQQAAEELDASVAKEQRASERATAARAAAQRRRREEAKEDAEPVGSLMFLQTDLSVPAATVEELLHRIHTLRKQSTAAFVEVAVSQRLARRLRRAHTSVLQMKCLPKDGDKKSQPQSCQKGSPTCNGMPVNVDVNTKVDVQGMPKQYMNPSLPRNTANMKQVLKTIKQAAAKAMARHYKSLPDGSPDPYAPIQTYVGDGRGGLMPNNGQGFGNLAQLLGLGDGSPMASPPVGGKAAIGAAAATGEATKEAQQKLREREMQEQKAKKERDKLEKRQKREREQKEQARKRERQTEEGENKQGKRMQQGISQAQAADTERKQEAAEMAGKAPGPPPPANDGGSEETKMNYTPKKGTKLVDSIPSGGGKFSYMFWIKPLSIMDDWGQVLHKGAEKKERCPAIWLIPKKSEVVAASGGYTRAAVCALTHTCAWLNTGEQLPLNKWTHVAVTHQEGALKVYFNGKLTKERELPAPKENSGPLWSTGPWYNPAKVVLSDMRHKPAIVSESDIQQAMGTKNYDKKEQATGSLLKGK